MADHKCSVCGVADERVKEAFPGRATFDAPVYRHGVPADCIAAIRAKVAELEQQNVRLLENVGESGWLIERADSPVSSPKYWAAGQREAERSSAWTSNDLEAIRFVGKEDAEKTARRLFPDIAVRICEHGWSGVRESAEREVERLRKVIEGAPHAIECDADDPRFECDCFKSKASKGAE